MSLINKKKSYQRFKSDTKLIGSCKGEEGVALVMTMLLGATLLTGVSALVVRQLTARKLVASESYRQIAEMAANNGLNQILSELNSDTKDNYRGYLLGLSNTEDKNDSNRNFSWTQINTANSPVINELCTDTTKGLPRHPEGTDKKWPTDAIMEDANKKLSIREDGKDALNAYYRLRSYKNPPKSNQLDNGEAKFIIEGIVRRKSMPEGQYLARARLERSLKVEAAVLKKRENDWAILFAKNYDLGNTSITGSGLIVWEVSEENAKTISKDCKTSNLLRHISNDAYQRIHERIWPVTNQILKNDSTRNLFQINKNIDIRASSGQKRIWRIDDTNSYQTGWPNYGNNSVCKRSRWRGLFPICERIDDGSDPTFQEDYYSVVKNVWDFYRQPEKYAGWEIVLSQEEFCPAQTGDCHIYIEHLNLQDSKLYIENDKRPVILHLITPNKDSSQISGSNGTFQISGTARICGVDQGQSKCNQKPERLIIMSDHDIKNPDTESTCISSTYPLKIEGNSLPHAFILLRQGTVELTASTTMNGAIWSRNICANRNDLNVSVPSNFIETVYDLWEWRSKNFSGFGRSVSRAIRGSGYDTFQRF